MNKIFFQLLHNRSKRLHGYDPYLNRGPDNPVLPLPVISSFVAQPTTITTEADSISVLRWTVAGATKVVIDQGVGDVTNVFGVNVKPGATTTYTMTATNASGSVKRAVKVTVAAALEALVANAVASNLSPTAGQTVDFKGSATGGTGGYSYAWSFSDGTGAASTQNTSRSFSAAGTYSATLTVTSNGVTATHIVELSVSSTSSAPTVSITHTPASPVVGDEVTYTAHVSAGTPPYKYSWAFGDGTSGGTSTTAKKTYNSTGEKTLNLTVVGGGTTVASYRINVGVGVPTPEPDLKLYQADPNFDPATAYPDAMTRNMARCFSEVMQLSSTTLRPPLEADSVFSKSRPTMVDLYSLRVPKIMLNFVRGILTHKPDPRFIKLLLPFVKEVLDNLETEWTTYPFADTPGSVDSNNKVIDRYASDVGQQRWNGYDDDRDNGGSRDLKAAYYRWVAWGRSTSRQSPIYRDRKATHEKTKYKKILYLHAGSESTGIMNYGTHLHILDNLMAHTTLGWACYILDVNRALSPEFQTYGQLGYDYIFNHWLPLLQETMAARFDDSDDIDGRDHPAKDIFNIRKALQHNAAAHAGLYALLVNWRRSRGQTPDARDVNALKKMMRMQIDQFKFYSLPGGLFEDSGNHQFANWSHHNNPYKVAIKLGTSPYVDRDQAVVGYDREFGGEVYNLYRMGLRDDLNRTLTRSMFAAMANSFAFIVYPKQTTSTFSKVNSLGIAGGGDDQSPSYAFFNNGSQRINNDWNGSKVAVAYGCSDGARYSEKGARYRDGVLGGWYMWADGTPGLKTSRNYIRRAKHCADLAYRLVPEDFVSTHSPTRRTAWQWLGCYLIMKLENPNRTYTGLDLSF